MGLVANKLESGSNHPALIGSPLTLESFRMLCGHLAGYSYVKVVVDRPKEEVHFLNDYLYKFHAHYIGENILKANMGDFLKNIDQFNRSVYLSADRRFYLGILALHEREKGPFFSLETVEVDNMDSDMLQFFYKMVRAYSPEEIPLVLKPANHHQEKIVEDIDKDVLPRIHNHELFTSADFVALNTGKSEGRLRLFKTEDEYRASVNTLEWYDIIVMDRVPDDIPRLSGIINTQHTTPLSHTNVLASGWDVPNCIYIEGQESLHRRGLDLKWVRYQVEQGAKEIGLTPMDPPSPLPKRPNWKVQEVRIDPPEIEHTPIVNLDRLRMSDRYRYGTKAANIGELKHLLTKDTSDRLLGFYWVPRPPRENLLSYLVDFLGCSESQDVSRMALEYLRTHLRVPRGIAIPFSVQVEFLSTCPHIQQLIGKVKMALELNAQDKIEPLCLKLQKAIRMTRLPDSIRSKIDIEIVRNLGGTSTFVVRSSSNAEDLENFSAAGIYESINHVTTADRLFDSIKEVWASLLSPRSVRLRQEVGISLDDCYMGVIVQEQVESEMGGVMVTNNPSAPNDFRNVYINVSTKSVNAIVEGTDSPYQYLYNTVEGGGRTLSIGSAAEDLSADKKETLQRLAFMGRLLQGHFSRDYTFNAPLDIEWVAKENIIQLLQLRPYST